MITIHKKNESFFKIFNFVHLPNYQTKFFGEILSVLVASLLSFGTIFSSIG